MEIENTDAAEALKSKAVEEKVRVRVTNVYAAIKENKRKAKIYTKNAWLFCFLTIFVLLVNALCDAKNWLIADVITLVLYVASFITLIHFDSKATTARGHVKGALMVLETLLPEAFLEDEIKHEVLPNGVNRFSGGK